MSSTWVYHFQELSLQNRMGEESSTTSDVDARVVQVTEDSMQFTPRLATLNTVLRLFTGRQLYNSSLKTEFEV